MIIKLSYNAIRTILFYTFPLFFVINMSCSGIPKEANEVIFESKRFKEITFNLIPEDVNGENKIKAIISGKLVFRGSYDYNNPIYVNSLGAYISNNPSYGAFYGFLKKNGFLEFKEYSIPYERENVPGVIFANLKRDFHKYTNSFIKYISEGGNGLTCILATRKLEKIIYTNQYKQNILGVEMPVFVLNFQYSIKPNLPHLSSSNKLFEGAAKVVKNPDNGKYELSELKLADEGSNSIINLITDKNIMQDINERKGDVLKELDTQRKINLSKASRFVFKINGEPSNNTWQFIGVLTSEDAFDIEPIRGNYNRVELKIVNMGYGTFIDQFQSEYKLGKIFQGIGDPGGVGKDFFISGQRIFFDLQKYNNLEGRSKALVYDVFVRLDGNKDSLAKVTIHCIDNSQINWGESFYCGDYPSPQGGIFNPDKSCIKCSKRFNLGRLVNQTSFVEEGTK
jgi:hypothetical protein